MVRSPASTREILDAVIESFASPAPAARDRRWSIEELAIFSHAREIFLAAGAARVEELTNPKRWLQIGVELDPRQQRLLLDDSFAGRVEEWMRAGAIRNFFFMNKPPGVRLRFCGQDLKRDFQRELLGFLDAAKAEDRLVRYEFGAYDGETYQFGGEVGLDLFHEHSTYDSLTAIRLLSLIERGENAAGPAVVSLLLLNDLFRRLVLDDWELWDVWSNMGLTGRSFRFTPEDATSARANMEGHRELLDAVMREPDAVIEELATPERELVRRYFERSASWSESLAEADRRGQLLWSLRKILPFYVVFHWNRLEIAPLMQITLTFFMQEFLNPKGDLRVKG